jgi:hypothetical protein
MISEVAKPVSANIAIKRRMDCDSVSVGVMRHSCALPQGIGQCHRLRRPAKAGTTRA